MPLAAAPSGSGMCASACTRRMRGNVRDGPFLSLHSAQDGPAEGVRGREGGRKGCRSRLFVFLFVCRLPRVARLFALRIPLGPLRSLLGTWTE